MPSASRPLTITLVTLITTTVFTAWEQPAEADVRRDITKLTAAELTAYRDALRQLQANGAYATLAGHHGCPDYYCHNDGRLFLPWHRAYVRRFEEALQQIDSTVALHYWDWTSDDAIENGIPTAFTDQTYQSGGMTYPNPLRSFHYNCGGRKQDTTRNPDSPFLLQFLKSRVEAAYELSSYDSFNDFGGIQGPHGSLHVWVGRDMGSTTWAAYDPIFWAHHSNVDRQWARWQDCHGGTEPSAAIKDLKLTPFGLKVVDVLDYRAMGYEYDDLGCLQFASAAVENPQAIRLSGIKVQPGVSQTLFVEGLPEHPENSVRVYVFVNQPDATLEDIKPDNPNFVGYFGIFGGEHGDKPGDTAQAAGDDHHAHEPEQPTGTPVLDLTPAIARIASASKAELIDLTLTILATDESGQTTAPATLPFDRVSVRPKKQ